MKKFSASMLVLAIAAVFMVGCSSTSKTMPGGSLVPQKADYTILGEVTGKGEATRIIGINFKTLFAKKSGSRDITVSAAGFNPLSLIGELPTAEGDAKTLAMYDAVSKLDAADMMLDPKWTVEGTNLFVIQTATATLKARALKFTAPSQAGGIK